MDEARRDTQLSINCTQIGTIQSFDRSTQLATIKIAMKQVVGYDETGAKILRDYPLLLECPVFTMFGGDDVITMPISSGDSCIVLFNDRQIDEWLNFGDGRPPSVSRVHDISDGIAIVGIRPLVNSIPNYIGGGIGINHAGGNSKIDLVDDLIDMAAALLKQAGNLLVTGDAEVEGDLLVNGGLTVLGTVTGDGSSEINVDADIVQEAGRSIHAGNGATGTFTSVTVVDGIVISGSSSP